jgi:transcriptional regulator with XRE-family HTH domain
MPRAVPDMPRTRAEEIRRARGISRGELLDRSGWHHTTVDRLMTGKAQLTLGNSGTLARVLDCPRPAFFEPIGAPIPPPGGSRRRPPKAMADRLAAILTLLDCDFESLVRFLLAGDYSGLNAATTERLRAALAAQPSPPRPVDNPAPDRR